MTQVTTTLSPADQVRADYPTHYLRYGEVLAICRDHGLGKHTAALWLENGDISHRQFNGPTSRKHYVRDELIALLFPPPSPTI